MSGKRHLINIPLISLLLTTTSAAIALDQEKSAVPQVGVGAQYATTHVYVAPEDVDTFAASFLSTFGGQSTKQVVATVTPTSSSTTSQLLQTPIGTVSLFGFKTPIPYPFGTEWTGYLVTDIDEAIKVAKESGADVLVSNFPDPIGRDAVIQWPAGRRVDLGDVSTRETMPLGRASGRCRALVALIAADRRVTSSRQLGAIV